MTEGQMKKKHQRSKSNHPAGYPLLLDELKKRIWSAQYEGLRAVNRELVKLYWDIGKLIVERQRNEGWGQAVIEQLAKDLQSEFPGIQGFSGRNLWRMRGFFLQYATSEILPPLVAEISWTHNIVILERCKNDLEREFYIRMAKTHAWSKNVLIHHIEGKSYERTLAGQTNFDHTIPSEIKDQARLLIKDEYTFSFLSLSDEHREKELEAAILSRVEPFLREMGGVFAFIGSQYRLEISGKEFFVDLLLYHRKLRCLVAVEIKTGEFIPEHVGKMQFYLAALDETVRDVGENLSIGIIICKSKDRTIVEYTLRDTRKPIGVATYRVVENLPEDLRTLLPAPEQIASLLKQA